MSNIVTMNAVANLTELSQLNESYLDSGAYFSVATLADIFMLDKTSSATVDGITVVTTLSGNGRWMRLCTANSKWQTYTSFNIDPVNGNDESDGQDENALKTWGEFKRRMGSRIWAPEITVKFIGDLVEEQITVDFAIEGHLIIEGELTELYSGTINCIQPRVAGTTETWICDAAIPISWTDSGYIGKLFVLTSGANAGAGNFILADMTLKTCRLAPLTAEAYGLGINPAGGDTYKIYSMTRFTGYILVQTGACGYLTFNHVDFDMSPGGPMFQVLGGCTGIWQSRIGMDTMEISTGSSCVQTDACYFYGDSVGYLNGGDIDSYNCTYTNKIVVTCGGRLLLYWGNIFQGANAGIQATGGGHAWINAYGMHSLDTCFFDVTAETPIVIEQGSCVKVQNYLWGNGNITGYAIKIESDGCLMFDTAYSPAILGATTAYVSVGGTNKTFAEAYAGFINTTNLARSVVRA